jgi:uncharacterized membrane protein
MAQDQFSKEEKDKIVQAIKTAENLTSGEIQVHLENHCKMDVMDRAAEIFAILKMHKTKLRNGVLFYMAIKDHKFAILGDEGINEIVPKNFWDEIKETMMLHFSQEHIIDGLVQGITMAGETLKQNFPILDDDENELPDEISFGDN